MVVNILTVVLYVLAYRLARTDCNNRQMPKIPHSLSLHLSSHHSPSLSLPFTDRSAIQTAEEVYDNNTNRNRSPPGDQSSSEEKAVVKRKVLREVLNCEREPLCRVWGGRVFKTRHDKRECEFLHCHYQNDTSPHEDRQRCQPLLLFRSLIVEGKVSGQYQSNTRV